MKIQGTSSLEKVINGALIGIHFWRVYGYYKSLGELGVPFGYCIKVFENANDQRRAYIISKRFVKKKHRKELKRIITRIAGMQGLQITKDGIKVVEISSRAPSRGSGIAQIEEHGIGR